MPAKGTKVKLTKASQITWTPKDIEAVQKALVPFEALELIADPDVYLESSAGKYVAGLEMLLKRALESNDIEMSRMLLLDLVKMTKIGRSKADINVGALSKLRDEVDYSKLKTEDIEALLKQVKGDGNEPV